jgi:hypothetical protein
MAEQNDPHLATPNQIESIESVDPMVCKYPGCLAAQTFNRASDYKLNNLSPSDGTLL